MEMLQSNLHRIRIPERTTRIFKQECCISFDTPRSEGGLFIDMNTFIAFGRDHVMWNYEKTGNPVYLHLKQTKKSSPEGRPSKKPTLLAMGVDGGFEHGEIEYDSTNNVVILPDFLFLPFPSSELPEKVKIAVDAILTGEDVERAAQVSAWIADKKRISMHAATLQQIGHGVVIPSSGWKCAKCDKTDNLWLNLTDGAILCGRSNWDGTGGNNHAIKHYEDTSYPLAVKLGTVTSNLGDADVFSYSEDETVTDPLLEQHLAFFGIDFSSLKKTELTTAERELDQNTNFDWNRIQESGQEMETLCGPGYTGLVNLGNSCYMAATIQVIFSTHIFSSRYYTNQSLREAFILAPADPTVDLNMQLTKLAHGLLSGKYSVSATEECIRPHMFKSVIAASNREFSSLQQQDALEFFLHFIDQVEQSNSGSPDLDPSTSFKFGIEERILCPSGKVSYNKRFDYILSLNIPLHEAINREELAAFNRLKAERTSQGNKVSIDEIVRPRVPLEACLSRFVAPEEVCGFYSSALNAKTTAIKTAGLTSFPDYLVLHMRKFVMEEGWVPKKLDVYVDVPDIIDISHLRSKGLQPGEELLPDTAEFSESEAESSKPLADESIVSQLVSMGFSHVRCQNAAVNTSNTGVEEAMNWLLSHMDDPDIENPVVEACDRVQLETLVSFGFDESIARRALKETGGDIEKATDWIFGNPDATAKPSAAAEISKNEGKYLHDGGGKYKLLGMVSHIGSSTHCGHYVAHINKDGRWAIFNDSKVGVSVNPPKDMGYLYFFQRLINVVDREI